MVEAYTIDGVINVNTEPFESAIKTVTTELAKLGDSTKQLMEMGGGDWNFNGALNGLKTLKDDLAVIKEDIATMNTEFANTQGINALKTEIASLRSEIDAIKQKVNETTTQTVQRVREVKTEISAIISGTEPLVQLWTAMNGQISEHYDILGIYNSEIGQINAQWRETQGLVQKNTAFIKEMEVSGSNVAKYFIHENELLETSLNFINQRAKSERTFDSAVTKSFSSLVRLSEELERQVITTQKRATALSRVGKEIIRNGSEIKKNLTYEEEMVATEKLFQNGLGEELASRIRINEQIKISNEMFMASKNAESQMLTLLNEEEGILSNLTGQREKSLAFIKEELTLEKEKASLIGEETALLNEQGAVRQKNAMKGNQLDKMGYLPSRIGSMAVTMWGFNEIMDIYSKSMQNMNAIGQQKAYTDLMKTDNRYLEQTGQSVNDITSGVNKMNKAINETYKGGLSLQKMYQKVDMQSVGANAMDSAFKYGVEADKLDELTEVMAIYGSEFVRQGRSQEDSILAVNDALDGEYRRLKEVNIGKEELAEHGYEEGDTLSMIKALREIAEERGYDVVAQKVTNLSDAITVLEIRIAQDLVGAFRVLEPLLTEVANDFIYMLDTFEWAFSGVRDAWNKFTTELDKTFGVQNVQKFGGGMLKFVGWAITLGITFLAVYKIVKSLKGMFSGLFSILGKGTDDIAKTTGDVAKTGGTVSSGGGFKDNFMKQWGKTGEDVGKIARAFVDIAVIMVGAFLLIEEAMLLISGIGATYDALKPQFESGIDFIKEYGLMLALLGGAMLGLSYVIGKIPDSAMTTITKGAKTLAIGMAIAMGLIAEAIVLLNAPLLAIASIGLVTEWTQDQIDDGMKTIHMFADALNYIASNDAILTFVLAFVGLSAILGYATETGIGSLLVGGLALGIAESLLLVAEAIGMLIVPLGAIALLGYSAESLDQANIQKGADTIRLIGDCLQALEPSIRNLLFIDMETFGINLVDWANKFITGKTGLESLVQDILPNLINFVRDFNELDMSGAESVDATKVQTITQMATDIPPLFNAIQKLNSSMGTSDMFGNISGAVGGFVSGSIGMGLKSKLDQLYNDIRDVMDFANKLGTLQSSGNGANANAITSIANAITQLKAKLDLMVSTVGTASVNLQSASKQLGSALTTGFKDGSSGFENTVVGVLAKGISEVQQRYQTWHNGGKASAEQLAKGFETIGGKLKSSVREEMGYALSELDNYKDDFYDKGAMLGQSLVDGFKSKKALDQNSPAKITKSIREELGYSMEALNTGKQMMYNGGVALGQALANGYNSYGNLRTDVGVLAQKGVSNEQLQANARKVQANGKVNQQTPQIFSPTINIDMSYSVVYGIQDLDARIKQSVEEVIVQYNSPNGAVGY